MEHGTSLTSNSLCISFKSYDLNSQFCIRLNSCKTNFEVHFSSIFFCWEWPYHVSYLIIIMGWNVFLITMSKLETSLNCNGAGKIVNSNEYTCLVLLLYTLCYPFYTTYVTLSYIIFTISHHMLIYITLFYAMLHC